ncbi:crosslink repair DNA glycosylase YcaQ family protein [Pseudonocardia yuanmonensis]|uniref:Crosslink repair DNA glycosylase YcaQ family protein n=1 Tax=Pseudonocardia yuanmonensis TaxID=1095914 RepID=A0ABP8W4C7_9PSEU
MSGTTPALGRRRVLAHRFAAHGLAARTTVDPAELRVLRLGVQDTPPGSLPLALAARLREVPEDVPADASVVWSHRGAPHLHPDEDLPMLAAACWPVSDADAAARLGWQRARLAAVGAAARGAIRTVAEAVGAVLAGGPLVKGELSTEVTRIVPERLSPWCGPCGVHHVGEQLLRLAGLPAGARLRPSTKPVVLEAIPGWPGPPADDDAGPAPVVTAYLDLFAPASAADVAGFLGTSVSAARPALPVDLVPVTVDGRAALCPPALLDELAGPAPDPAGTVRLLPPSDPYLQGRDREVLVPAKEHRSIVWKALGPPGVVAVDGDIVGVWRTRARGRVLEITVDAFRPLSRAENGAVDAEAERIRQVRGAREVVVRAA